MPTVVAQALNEEMISAVQALINGERSERHHGKTGYRSWCACCAPQEVASPGKPRRRAPQRPQLAWRIRQAAVLAQGEGDHCVL
jgi:hypothetical protein